MSTANDIWLHIPLSHLYVFIMQFFYVNPPTPWLDEIGVTHYFPHYVEQGYLYLSVGKKGGIPYHPIA